jgi:hypothetical protein
MGWVSIQTVPQPLQALQPSPPQSVHVISNSQ